MYEILFKKKKKLRNSSNEFPLREVRKHSLSRKQKTKNNSFIH